MPKLQVLFRRRKKPDGSGNADLARDLSIALCIKFCLLGILWWAFFAGKKVPVDAGSVERVLLNPSMNRLQEKP
ncbi:cytochrome oxidase putative small subunit CydP [Methylomicrobium album]|uniref:Uncharacterized protein n=1 Tax=Methylomicrobium album BG8 TaxID=686340 RepID=H8GMJ9_METAL|nr:hypothetical protein Metal_0383 [Methylomicrobium album BG8]